MEKTIAMRCMASCLGLFLCSFYCDVVSVVASVYRGSLGQLVSVVSGVPVGGGDRTCQINWHAKALAKTLVEQELN